MNLILVEAHELDDDSRAHLRDARARHAHDVLRAAPGDELRIGRLDGPLGRATVTTIGPDHLDLHCRFDTPAPPRPRDTLLLAVPRPKVLRRCLEDAAALGFGHIVLLRTWRVDKSHLQSNAMHPDQQRAHLCAGLAQGRRTHLPTIATFPLFKPFVEDHLPAHATPANRFVADPDADLGLASARIDDTPLTLAIGPERGFLPYEVDALAAHAFTPIHAGRHPLRVETALARLHGQLDLHRDLHANRHRHP